MFFWNSLAFSMIQQMLAIWSLVPLPFLNPAWTSEAHGSHIVVRSMSFLSFVVPIFAWNVPLVSLIFLTRSSAFYCCPLFFALIAEEGFLISSILWNSAFKWVYLSFSPLPFTSPLFTAICKASSDNHFAFLHFSFLRLVLIAASCTMSQTSVFVLWC